MNLIMTVMKPQKRNNRKLERGQSLVELAISFPIILLLMLGTLDFGMATYSYLIVRDAAQEGALYGSINPNSNNEIENRVRFMAPLNDEGLSFAPVKLDNKDDIKIKIETSGRNCQGLTGGKVNTISVHVSYNYPLIIPFAELVNGSNTVLLEATATNVIIQPACN
jgi:Flp pilus assembly protein TadG